MKYAVYVTETKVKRYHVTAESEAEAIEKVKQDQYTLSWGLCDWHDTVVCAKEEK